VTTGSLFARDAAAAGVPLAPGLEDRLRRFTALLLEENKVQNLTSIEDEQGTEVDHLLDSLALQGAARAAGRPLAAGDLAVDIGSGGGFPGIPLALAVPGSRWVLVESEGRKFRWLERAALEMGLEGTVAFRGRGREVRTAMPECAGAAAWVTARAVADLGTLCREARGLLAPGGLLLCPKGREGLTDAERALGLREAGKSRYEYVGDFPMAVPGRDRICVVYRRAR
jgi:16S rRNA (guanine527-N7)-methyltransferase